MPLGDFARQDFRNRLAHHLQHFVVEAVGRCSSERFPLGATKVQTIGKL
jgi:hypothetical protein